MNRRELRSAVYAHTGFASDDTLATTERLNGLINDALHFVEAEHDWPWLQASETLTTTSGTATVTPGATWKRTRFLTYSAVEVTEVSVDSLDLMASASGAPEHFAVWGDVLRLWPTPDGAYALTHRFFRTESDLSSDDSEPLMPAQFHPALVDYVAFLLLSSVRDEERAGAKLASYREWMRVMTDDRRRSSGPYRVRSRPGGWL